jgi:hypothetical protein
VAKTAGAESVVEEGPVERVHQPFAGANDGTGRSDTLPELASVVCIADQAEPDVARYAITAATVRMS